MHTTEIRKRQRSGANTRKRQNKRREDAARCTQAIKRNGTQETSKCSIMPGKKKLKRKPLTELYVNGKFTEDRDEWKRELQRHCDEVSTDPEETSKVQEERIEYFKRKGDLHFIKNGRRAEITIDLVLQARGKCRKTTSADQKAPL